MSNREKKIKTNFCGDVPYYEAICKEDGSVYFRIDRQTFRISYDPKAFEKDEGIDGVGKKHGEWLQRQLQIALDKLAFAYEDIKTPVQ